MCCNSDKVLHQIEFAAHTECDKNDSNVNLVKSGIPGIDSNVELIFKSGRDVKCLVVTV